MLTRRKKRALVRKAKNLTEAIFVTIFSKLAVFAAIVYAIFLLTTTSPETKETDISYLYSIRSVER